MSIEVNKIVKYGFKLSNSLSNYNVKKSKEYLNHIKFYSQKGGAVNPPLLNKEIENFEEILTKISETPDLYNIQKIRKDLEGKIESKTNELTASNNKISELERQLEELRNNLSSTSSQLGTQNNTLSEQIKTKEAELAQYKKDKESQLAQNSALSEQIKSTEAELARYKTETESQLAQKSNELKQCESDKEQKLKQKDDELRQLEDSITNLISNDEMGNIPDNIKGTLREKLVELDNKKKECKQLKIQLDGTSSELQNKKTDLEKKLADYETMSLELSNIKSQNFELNALIKQLRDEIEDLKRKIAVLTQQNLELTNVNQKLTKDNQELTNIKEDIIAEFMKFDSDKALIVKDIFIKIFTIWLGKDGAEKLFSNPKAFDITQFSRPERKEVVAPERPVQPVPSANSPPAEVTPRPVIPVPAATTPTTSASSRPVRNVPRSIGGGKISYVNEEKNEIQLIDYTGKILKLKIGDFISFIHINGPPIIGCIKEFEDDDNQNLEFIKYYEWNDTKKEWTSQKKNFIDVNIEKFENEYKNIKKIEYPYEAASKISDKEIRINKLKINLISSESETPSTCINFTKDTENIFASVIGFEKEGNKIRKIKYKYWREDIGRYDYNDEFDFIDLFSPENYYTTIKIIDCIEYIKKNKEKEDVLQQKSENALKEKDAKAKLASEQKIKVKTTEETRAEKDAIRLEQSQKEKDRLKSDQIEQRRKENEAKLERENQRFIQLEKERLEKERAEKAIRIASFVDDNTIKIKIGEKEVIFTKGECMSFTRNARKIVGKIKDFIAYKGKSLTGGWDGFGSLFGSKSAAKSTQAVESNNIKYVDGIMYVEYDSKTNTFRDVLITLNLIDNSVNYSTIEKIDCNNIPKLTQSNELEQSDYADIYNGKGFSDTNNAVKNGENSYQILINEKNDLENKLKLEFNEASTNVNKESSASPALSPEVSTVESSVASPEVSPIASNNSDVWEERFSKKHNKPFWHNNSTGENTWTNPDSNTVVPAVVPAVVPNNWVEKKNKAGRTFWHNLTTDEKTWDNWVQKKNKAGKTFWHNLTTDEKTWNNPLHQTGGNRGVDKIIELLDDFYKIYNSEIILKIIGLLSYPELFQEFYETLFSKPEGRQIMLDFVKLFFIDVEESSILIKTLTLTNIINRDTYIYNLYDPTNEIPKIFTYTLIHLLKNQVKKRDRTTVFFNSEKDSKEITIVILLIYNKIKLFLTNYSDIITLKNKISTLYNKLIIDKRKVFSFVKIRKDPITTSNGKISKNTNPRYNVNIIDNSVIKKTDTKEIMNKYLVLRYYNVDGVFGKDDNGVYDYKRAKSEIEKVSKDRKEYYYFGPFDGIFNQDKTNVQVADDSSELILDKILNKNEDICVIGYGQSGSGKTSTLIYLNPKDEDGILINLCNDPNIIKNFDSINLKMVDIYAYHGTRAKDMSKIETDRDYKCKLIGTNFKDKMDYNPKFGKWGGILVGGKMVGGKWVYENEINEEKLKVKRGLGKIINDAFNNREIEPTPNNPDSSRSHVIVCITLNKNDKPEESRKIIVCDLAGVENVFNCDDSEEMRKFDMQYQKSTKYKNPIDRGKKATPIELDRYICDQEINESIPIEDFKLIEQYNDYLPKLQKGSATRTAAPATGRTAAPATAPATGRTAAPATGRTAAPATGRTAAPATAPATGRTAAPATGRTAAPATAPATGRTAAPATAPATGRTAAPATGRTAAPATAASTGRTAATGRPVAPQPTVRPVEEEEEDDTDEPEKTYDPNNPTCRPPVKISKCKDNNFLEINMHNYDIKKLEGKINETVEPKEKALIDFLTYKYTGEKEIFKSQLIDKLTKYKIYEKYFMSELGWKKYPRLDTTSFLTDFIGDTQINDGKFANLFNSDINAYMEKKLEEFKDKKTKENASKGNLICDYERLKKLKYNCELRKQEGYRINRSLKDLRDDIKSLIKKSLLLDKRDNFLPIFYEKEIYPYCRNINIYDEYFDDFYMVDDDTNKLSGILFDIMSPNKNQDEDEDENSIHFDLEMGSLNFVIFTVINLTDNGDINNPPNPPFINLNDVVYNFKIDEDLPKLKNSLEHTINIMKEYTFYASDDIVKRELTDGDTTSIKSFANELLEKVEINNSATLIGSLVSTDILSNVVYNKVVCSRNNNLDYLLNKYKGEPLDSFITNEYTIDQVMNAFENPLEDKNAKNIFKN